MLGVSKNINAQIKYILYQAVKDHKNYGS